MAMKPLHDPLTRTTMTEQSYRDRAARGAESASKAAARKLTPAEFAEMLLQIRRTQLAPSSWRQVRAAFAMGEAAALHPRLAAQLDAAVAMLNSAEPVLPEPQPALHTSQHKEKGLTERQLQQIGHTALATGSPYAPVLVDAVVSTSFAAPPRRVADRQMGPCGDDGFAWQLRLVNGKQGNGRAHGEPEP